MIDTVTAPNGATAWASIDPGGAVHVRVRCGDPLDEVVLRSYCTGAAHMALGWVRRRAWRSATTARRSTSRSARSECCAVVDTPPITSTSSPTTANP